MQKIGPVVGADDDGEGEFFHVLQDLPDNARLKEKDSLVQVWIESFRVFIIKNQGKYVNYYGFA